MHVWSVCVCAPIVEHWLEGEMVQWVHQDGLLLLMFLFYFIFYSTRKEGMKCFI